MVDRHQSNRLNSNLTSADGEAVFPRRQLIWDGELYRGLSNLLVSNTRSPGRSAELLGFGSFPNLKNRVPSLASNLSKTRAELLGWIGQPNFEFRPLVQFQPYY